MNHLIKKTVTQIAANQHGDDKADRELAVGLERRGINPTIVQKVMTPAKFMRLRQSLQSKENRSEDEDKQLENLKVAKTKNSDLDTLYYGPVQWKRGAVIDQHVDAPMHLLFLGIVKSVTVWLVQWATERKQTTAFDRLTKQMPLSDIQALNLSWVKTLPYKGAKLGGWISENYLAHARLLKWFYGWVDMAMTDTDADKDNDAVLDKNVTKWKVNTMKKWLRVRKLVPPKGANAAALKDMIQADINKEGGSTPPVVARGIQARFVVEMLQALQCMVSILMSAQCDTAMVETSRRYINIFLTLFARCDKALHSGDGKDKYKWLSAYNFLSLLNLPAVIRNYGCLRNIWEGGIHGEGSLRAIKPHAIKGLGGGENWHKQLLINVHEAQGRNQLMKTVMSNPEDKSNEVDPTSNDANRGKIHVYKTVVDALDAFKKNKPLSVTFANKPDRFYMQVKSPEDIIILLKIKSVIPYTKAGMTYLEFAAVPIKLVGKGNLDHEGRVATLFLPVPKLSCMKGNGDWAYDGCYAVINEEWKELDESGTFIQPRPSLQKESTGAGTCFAQNPGVVSSILDKWYGNMDHTNAVEWWQNKVNSEKNDQPPFPKHNVEKIQATTEATGTDTDLKEEELEVDFDDFDINVDDDDE